MRKILISVLLIGAMLVSVPASAQSWGQGRGYRSVDRIVQQIDRIEDRIRDARERRLISRGEAERLLRRSEHIDRLEDRYSRNGLTREEVQDLRRRVPDLRQQLRFERPDRRYADRYDDPRDRRY